MEATDYTARQLRVIAPIVRNIEERFKNSPHETVRVVISFKQIKEETGIQPSTSSREVRYFLGKEGIPYKPKRGGPPGTRYFIQVTRGDYERWKKLIKVN